MTDAPTYKLRLPDGTEFGPAAIELLVYWAQQGRVPTDAVLVPTEGGPTMPVMDAPDLARTLQSPPTVTAGVPVPDSPMTGMIPYRNPPALVGYYLAVFSLIPPLGLALGPVAVICGILGFVKARRDPQSKGKVHAWVAIILGALTTIGYWAVAVSIMLTVHRARQDLG